MKDLRGKVAVVTGAASGIGRALVGRFCAEGMKVVLADVEEPALEAAVDELESSGAEVVGVRTDVSRAEDVETLAARTIEAFGTVHVVCNNAGVTGGGPFTDISLETWHWVLGVNFRGVVHGCRTFLPLLEKAGEGHIVNTASIGAIKSLHTVAPYVSSKFAVLGLSENLFHELAATGSPVGVSVLCPSFVSTRILDADRNRPPGVPASDDPRRRQYLALARVALAIGLEPGEVAAAALDAIRSRRFYVLPNFAEACEAVEERLHWMRTNEPPVSAKAAFTGRVRSRS